MLTVRDITIMRKVFNEEFDRKFDSAFDRKFDEKFDEKMTPILRDIRNDIAMFKDEILSVLHPLQEDHTVLGSHVRQIYDTVEGHEGRIVTLERSRSHPPVRSVNQ